MRKYYIDNLRTLCILLLFPYHTFMIYNPFESFYIHGPVVKPLTAFLLVTWPWFMPLLFVLAGISAGHALERRSAMQFLKERVLKLFVPLVFGILLLVPVQTYFAERFHNGYTGGYFAQYILFFTKPTDLMGYNGGFTPGHLWFVMYLFAISLLALPIMLWYNKRGTPIDGSRFTMPKLFLTFLLPLVMTLVLDFGGKSVGQYFTLYLLGFFVFRQDTVIERLERYRWPLAVAGALLLSIGCILYFANRGSSNSNSLSWLLDGIPQHFTMWVCVLAMLGLGKRYFNKPGRISTYLSGASFAVYVFHQSWLVAIAYYVFKLTDMVAIQVPIIMIVSFILTILTYEVTKRFSVTRFMFGLKNPTPQKEAAGKPLSRT